MHASQRPDVCFINRKCSNNKAAFCQGVALQEGHVDCGRGGAVKVNVRIVVFLVDLLILWVCFQGHLDPEAEEQAALSCSVEFPFEIK